MDAMKKAIMKRRAKFMPEMEEDDEMLAMTDEADAEMRDDEGESGLAPKRDISEDMQEDEAEENSEMGLLSEDSSDAEMMPESGMEEMAVVESKSGLSPEELQAIAEDLMRGLNKDKPGIAGKAAMRMMGSIKR